MELPKRSPDTAPVITDGPLSCVTFPWRLVPEQDALVVVAKLTFDIAADGSTTLREEPMAATGDELVEEDNEHSSLRYANDFEPFKPKADLLLVGNAYPPRGAKVARAGFGFGRQRWTLAAIGERQWEGAGPSTSQAFRKMPLVWERAFGGPGHAENPVGRGYAEGGAGLRLPNLEREGQMISARGDRPPPVCFAPICRQWPPRSRKMGTYDDRWLAERWPYYPADFDWAVCNSAPEDQQIAYPDGDERFEFFGLRPEHPVVSGALPGIVPRVVVQYGPDEGFRQREPELHLDTVWFDAEAMTAALTWRGHVPVSAEGAPEVALLFACVDKLRAKLPLASLRERLTGRLAELDQDEQAPMSRAVGFGRSLFGRLPPPEESGAPMSMAGDTPEPPVPSAEPALSRSEVEALVASGQALDQLDLSGCDLSRLNLADRSLLGANLSRAVLDGAVFDGARLSGASLVQARGGAVSFRGADLRESNLSGAKLPDCNFSNAALMAATCDDLDASRGRFENVAGAYASFTGAQLREARFDSAQLEGATFESAQVRRASFAGANLAQVKLYEASAVGTTFAGATLTGLRADEAKLSECNLSDANARSASFQSASLERADLSRAVLEDAVFLHAKLELARFEHCKAARARFDGADLSGTKFTRANLMQASLLGTTLSGASFREANLWQVELWKSIVDDAAFEGAFLRGTKLAP